MMTAVRSNFGHLLYRGNGNSCNRLVLQLANKFRWTMDHTIPYLLANLFLQIIGAADHIRYEVQQKIMRAIISYSYHIIVVAMHDRYNGYYARAHASIILRWLWVW